MIEAGCARPEIDGLRAVSPEGAKPGDYVLPWLGYHLEPSHRLVMPHHRCHGVLDDEERVPAHAQPFQLGAHAHHSWIIVTVSCLSHNGLDRPIMMSSTILWIMLFPCRTTGTDSSPFRSDIERLHLRHKRCVAWPHAGRRRRQLIGLGEMRTTAEVGGSAARGRPRARHIPTDPYPAGTDYAPHRETPRSHPKHDCQGVQEPNIGQDVAIHLATPLPHGPTFWLTDKTSDATARTLHTIIVRVPGRL